MALQRPARCSIRLLLREQAEILTRLNPQTVQERAQLPSLRPSAACCSSAQLQHIQKMLIDNGHWSHESTRGFHISIQGHQSAQAAAVQQQEDEDNEPEQTRSQGDAACSVRKEDVKQSETLLPFPGIYFEQSSIRMCLASSLLSLTSLEERCFDAPCY